jgi:hypothetical protein
MCVVVESGLIIAGTSTGVLYSLAIQNTRRD